MRFTRARVILVTAVIAACGLAANLSQTVAATPSPSPSGPSAPVVPDGSVAAFRERGAMLRAMQARFAKPVVQRFAIAGLTPVVGWKAVGGQEAAAAQAGSDYQRRCALGVPSISARIDRVREPVAPGAVVRIAGDCFGTLPGTVTLAGVRPSPVRLIVQSWSNTVIEALVPSIVSAHHQTAVLTVAHASGGERLAGDSVVSGHVRGAAADAAARAVVAPGSGAPPNANVADAAAIERSRPRPDRVKVVTVGTSAATSARPSDEATVEFWPEIERRTLGTDAIANRSCGFARCVSLQENNPGNIPFWATCPAPCADHEAMGRPSGVNADGIHWLHEADDLWVVAHPADWHVEQVNVLKGVGEVSIGPPQEIGPDRSLLKFHWQDVHNLYQDQESGPWFFSTYSFTVTVVGPKGTWSR